MICWLCYNINPIQEIQTIIKTMQIDPSNQILSLMKDSRIYWQAKRQVTNMLLRNKNSPVVHEDIFKTILLTGNEDKINGLINNCLQKSTKRLPIEKDSHPEIDTYRVKWSDIISKQFTNIATKIVRQQQYDEEDESVSYIYDSSSLLQFLSSIKIKNAITVRESPIFLFPLETLKVPKYSQLRQKYSFLNHPQNILGAQLDNDLRDREKRAKKIVDGENISGQIQNFLLMGCINGERVSVYRRYFECFYEHSGKRVQFTLYEKIWKHLIKSDSKQVLKDPIYFVFKEAILKLYEIFVCDKQLTQMLKIRQLSGQKLDKYAPIHATLPSKNFAHYLAPFCYASTNIEQIYELFRWIYANYIILLHTISSLPDSILSLCLIFEQLLYTTQKKLVTKFEQLQIQPIRIVFPWIFYCFIGYIPPEQFFLILDRIIGTKSLEILPLYCISILFKEKSAILQAKNQSQIQQILQYSLEEDCFVETIRQFFKYHL